MKGNFGWFRQLYKIKIKIKELLISDIALKSKTVNNTPVDICLLGCFFLGIKIYE